MPKTNLNDTLSAVIFGLVFGLAAASPALAADADAPQETPDWYSLHIQGTYTTMGHGHFGSAMPDGAQSMLAQEQIAETGDVTLYAGVRIGQVELYYNPEMDQGFGPSSTYGVAGYPSGEAYKAGQYAPYFRTPRLFGRYIINLGGEAVPVEDAINQLAGTHDSNNITLTFGKFGIPDIFDTNTYAHDPKNDFLNWAVVESGAFDYGAELWGFTYGGAVEWTHDWWTLRGGLFDMSRQPNSGELTVNFRNSESIVEGEERHELYDQPGKVKLMAFLMSARMGAYADAVNWGLATGQTPTTQAVRHFRIRPGGGINIEQQVAPSIGVFAKGSMNDGQYEEYDFTEIHQSLAGGVSIKGDLWGRDDDVIGIGAVINGISSNAQKYFAAGGMGGLIGDGGLPIYGNEQILEAYYKFVFVPGVHLTLDYQHVDNPAYNAVRGPIDFAAFRMHLEY